jgi:hypothetical protein
MDPAYKYGYCHKYRPGRKYSDIHRTSSGEPDDVEVQELSNGWTQKWCPSDNRAQYGSKQKESNELGWTEDNVSYRFNQWGFRHDEDFVENPNSIVFLGCSLTMGVGVNYEQTWPYYVSKELGLDCINLGQPGTGIQSAYRVAKMWLPVIKPKAVMFYVPDPNRKELWPDEEGEHREEYGDAAMQIGHWHSETGWDKKYYEYWKMQISKREADIYKMAYLDAISWLCKDSRLIQFSRGATMNNEDSKELLRGSQLIFTQSKTDNAEIARDMMHPGPKQYRENVAPLFVKAYNNENYNVDLGYGES